MNTKTFDLPFIIFSIIISVFGAIIGMQLITSLGITPNTSIIGALIAMLIARIPMKMFYKYRSIENQNLIQTSISAATFGAANSLLIPIGLPFVMGMPELIMPMMIGAGSVALLQFVITLWQSKKEKDAVRQSEEVHEYTRSDKDIKKGFGLGFLLYLVAAMILAVVGGIIGDMSVMQTVLFVVFAAFAALASEIIVGIAAMHSGWFPAFAVTLISLLIGMMLGFPPIALALLTGFTAATGPAFADLGYDFKSGAILRVDQKKAIEIFGRRQQLKSSLIGFGVAIVMVILFHDSFFAQDLVPPVDRVYATTIESGLSGNIGMLLLLWAIPGAIIQLIGGPKRQMGILFATGLLIINPIAGWAVIAGILIRFIVLKVKGPEAESAMYTMAAGFIAGDAIYSFFTSLWKAK